MPPPQGGETNGPMDVKFFTQFYTDNFTLFLTNNFDNNISLRELTLHTIEIHIFRPLHFTHINIGPKSISINHNVAPKFFKKHFSFHYNSSHCHPHKGTHPT